MNLNELPWWKNDYKSNHRMNGDSEYLNANEFLERLNNFPLTKDLTISFLEKHVARINIIKLTASKFKGKIYRVDRGDSFNFEIMINSNNYLNKKSSALIHECMHGIYRVAGNGDDSIIEKILCKHESSFYDKNKEFSINLFKKYTKLKRV